MAALHVLSHGVIAIRSRSNHLNTPKLPVFRTTQPGNVRLPAHVSARRAFPTPKCKSVDTSADAPPLSEQLKRAVSWKALELVESGMTLAIGAGSTSCIAIQELGLLVAEGKVKDIQVVVTSFQSQIIARQNNIQTVDMNSIDEIHLAFDGADEVDTNMNLIKGGGAGHTLEKVFDSMANQTVIIVDDSKVVSKLGVSFPVPVEVLPQALTPVLRNLLALEGVPEIRAALMKDGAVITDLGNMIVDVRFPGGVDDPVNMEQRMNNIPGVVENGLFCNKAKKVLVATTEGDNIVVLDLADFVKRSGLQQEQA